jgi:hypothetical protein
MAHFAKLDENNIVLEIHVVENEYLKDPNGVERETLGIAFLINWSGGYSLWKQTSYNSSFRKNYACVGYPYDAALDAFYPAKLFDSWVLNEETVKWEPPIPYPTNGKNYYWDESVTNWTEVTE